MTSFSTENDIGVSNEKEHCVRPETEQQKSPLTKQLERRPDRTQLSYVGQRRSGDSESESGALLLAQRGAVAGDSLKQQALLRVTSSAGRHSAKCSEEAVEIQSRSLRMSTSSRRLHFGPQTGGPSALMAAIGWTLLAGPHGGRASPQE